MGNFMYLREFNQHWFSFFDEFSNINQKLLVMLNLLSFTSLKKLINIYHFDEPYSLFKGNLLKEALKKNLINYDPINKCSIYIENLYQ